jgi:hypothetical protein
VASFRYSTQAQFRQRLREEFATATGQRLHRLAAWADVNLTDAQLQTLFNRTAAQVPALRTKLQTMRARVEALDAEVGA